MKAIKDSNDLVGKTIKSVKFNKPKVEKYSGPRATMVIEFTDKTFVEIRACSQYSDEDTYFDFRTPYGEE